MAQIEMSRSQRKMLSAIIENEIISTLGERWTEKYRSMDNSSNEFTMCFGQFTDLYRASDSEDTKQFLIASPYDRSAFANDSNLITVGVTEYRIKIKYRKFDYGTLIGRGLRCFNDNGEFKPTDFTGIIRDIATYGEKSFWFNEPWKHGTCAMDEWLNGSQKLDFKNGREASEKAPEIICQLVEQVITFWKDAIYAAQAEVLKTRKMLQVKAEGAFPLP